MTVPPAEKGRRRKKQARADGSPPVAAAQVQKLTHLVIDSGAIIKGAGMTLASAAEVGGRICCRVSAWPRFGGGGRVLNSLPFTLPPSLPGLPAYVSSSPGLLLQGLCLLASTFRWL